MHTYVSVLMQAKQHYTPMPSAPYNVSSIPFIVVSIHLQVTQYAKIEAWFTGIKLLHSQDFMRIHYSQRIDHCSNVYVPPSMHCYLCKNTTRTVKDE